jgi:putative ABC transport system permease protein
MRRLLLHLYPQSVREQRRAEIESAIDACVARERLRAGAAGAAYAWLRLVADAIAAGALMRLDAAREHRITALSRAHTGPKETGMNRFWQDVKYAARGMRRAPVFTTIVVATMALAIGATTAVFTVVNGVLLRSLPYREPDRLMMVYENMAKMAMPIGFSPPDYFAFIERAEMFESVAAFRNREYELSGVEPPERITALRASASLFDTLGVKPAVGSVFTRADDEGARPVAVISDALWARKFGRDPGVVGRAVKLDRRPYTIVGVMPRTFTFPSRGPHLNNVPADIYLPISFTAGMRGAFGSMYNNSVVTRLKPGVTPARANADVAALVAANAAQTYPAALSGLAQAISASATPLQDAIVGRAKRLLLVAFAAVVFVLLIACADIAALMLTRAASRQREMAVRNALGAGRGRIIRQMLVESMLTALAGGVLGVLIAWWVSRVIPTLAPPTLPRLTEMGIDWRILAFTALVSVVTAVLCGVLPALELSRPDTSDALKEGGRTGMTGTRQRRIFNTLVAAQVALAVVLLAGGGLLVRSFTRLMAVDAGFRADHVLTLATSLPASGYPTAADVRGFYTRLVEGVRNVPGVSAAGASTDLPLGVRERRAFTIENESAATIELSHGIAAEWVMGTYFDALGIPVLRGRSFGNQDAAGSEPAVIINETLARTFFPGEDPVGRRLAWGNRVQHGDWMRIVGLVRDVKQGPLNTATEAEVYVPWLQVNDRMVAENVVGQMRSLRLAVRTDIDPAAMASTIRQQIRAIDPALPISAVNTMEEVVQTSAAPQRFNAMLLGSFALLALLLAALGIGGVLATSVSRRTQELGVRMALGARRGNLVGMVVRQGMSLAAVGVAAGLPVAWMLTRLMSTLLFEISPRDPVTFTAVATLLLAVALLACAIPAWRATRVDPMAALRRE